MTFSQDALNKVVDDIAESIMQFRRAEEEEEVENNRHLVYMDELGKQWINEIGTAFKGQLVNMSGTTFWGLIIRAKIEVIEAIGGIGLMKKVCYELEGHPEEEKYHFVSRFDKSADGIGGWCA